LDWSNGQETEDNGGHSFVPISAKWLASGTDDLTIIYDTSPWLALWFGMVSHWLSGHLIEYYPRNSFRNLKQHYSTELELRVLLSSPT